MRIEDLSPTDRAALRTATVARSRDRSVAVGPEMPLVCTRCGVIPGSDTKRTLHAVATGHIRFQWNPEEEPCPTTP